MAQGGFPGAGLVTQLFRQLCKPTSQRIVVYAAQRPTFRRYFLLLPGKFYHRLEEHLKHLKEPRVVEDKSKKLAIRAIKDEEAVEIGSQLMIEIVIFALLSTLLICDYIRSQYKNAIREERQQEELMELVERKAAARERLEEIELEIARLRDELQLQRELGELLEEE